MDVLREVLEYLKLPSLNEDTIENVKEMIESMDELWKGVAGWNAAT
jgi:hypothetical protein